MPIKRLTVAAALVSVLLLSGPVSAATSPASALVTPNVAPQLLDQLPIFSPAPKLAQAIVPSYLGVLMGGEGEAVVSQATRLHRGATATGKAGKTADVIAPIESTDDVTDLRKALISLAMKLRDIRYVRGGHDPSTGFDCSGFVRYVFAHAIGLQLPTNSAAQFLAGLKVKRADIKPGDLVFFHTQGRHRVSHVGIYISDGRFIHSPTTGKSVEISSLDNAYWSRHFIGAKRPQAIAQVASNG